MKPIVWFFIGMVIVAGFALVVQLHLDKIYDRLDNVDSAIVQMNEKFR